MNQSLKIKCPHCDTEYLPSEIFLPNYFLGKAGDVEKDPMGKIVYDDGIDQDLEETYTCDRCLKPFKVTASISFKTESVKKLDLDAPYVSQREKKLVLRED